MPSYQPANLLVSSCEPSQGQGQSRLPNSAVKTPRAGFAHAVSLEVRKVTGCVESAF